LLIFLLVLSIVKSGEILQKKLLHLTVHFRVYETLLAALCC